MYLLSDWIAVMVFVAIVYSIWNGAGLKLHLEVQHSRPASGSPIDEVPDVLLRNGPRPAPIFEGDGLAIEIGLDTTGAPRGPAWLAGNIGSTQLAVGTGLVPRDGWRRLEEVGELRRGSVGASSWVITSSDPLGFFRGRRKCPDVEVAVVLPRFTSLARQLQVRELEASIAAPRAGSGTELFGVREYRPGDALRRIHWRSSARHGELVVREYEPPGVQALGIFCEPAPASREVADQIARLAASEVWDCLRDGGRVVLWAPGLEPSLPRESRSFWALLEWLARYPTEAGDEIDPPAVSEAVAVTGRAEPRLVEALETARRRGARVRAWVVGDADLDVDAPVQHVGEAWPI